MNNIRISIWGFGAMGSGMAKMLLKKQGVELVAVCDMAESRVDRDMYEVLGIDQGDRKPVRIVRDPVVAFPAGSADVVLIATDSFTRAAFDKLVFCLQRGMNVISTAEELAYPTAKEPELSKELHQIARDNDVTILGTGINPGFVMDYLLLLLSGACESVDSVRAERVNDLSPFGLTVMEEQGVGVTPEAFLSGVEDNSIAGHVGFPESIQMIADGLGWNLDKVTETCEPIISSVDRKIPQVEVAAGHVAGCRQCGYGYVNGELKMEMVHPQQIIPEAEGVDTGDTIQIKGIPDIEMKIKPEIPGGIGTIAVCVNMIPQVINAEAGLKTMLDLPVLRAVMGDFRDRVDVEKRIIKQQLAN